MSELCPSKHIDELTDDELPVALWEYVIRFLEEHGSGDDRRYRAAVLALPRGLRATLTLMQLDSEVRNGGFYQYFTNSSGQFAKEALEDLHLIGARQYADLLERAVAVNRRIESRFPAYRDRSTHPEPHLESSEQDEFWSEITNVFLPEFEALDSAFYGLDESESLWKHFVAYIRRNRDESIHENHRGLSQE